MFHFKGDESLGIGVRVGNLPLMQQLLHNRHSGIGKHVEYMATDHLVGLVAPQALVGRADVQDSQVGIGLPDDIQRILRQ